MQNKFQYTTVDTILSKYLRDFRGGTFNEDDAIEWIGEAMGFMKMAQLSSENVAFIEVKNYEAALPLGLHYIIQIAKDTKWSPAEPESVTPQLIIENLTQEEFSSPCTDCDSTPVAVVDCQGNLIGASEIAYYRPYFNLQYEYLGWTVSNSYRNNYVPVRLADHSFFNSIVCREDPTTSAGPYVSPGTSYEYTIVNDLLRFSFKEGYVAVSYLGSRLDETTGFPLIPDDESAKAAITYYLGWKTQERDCWNHREGACQLSDKAEAKWLKYIKQFKNKAKMPWGLDEYQDLMQQGSYLVPRRRAYFGYFGRQDRTTRTYTKY